MNFGARREVSLRGASLKQSSRDELLNKVAEERLLRIQAKKEVKAAKLIQRVWAGRVAAAKTAGVLRATWDSQWGAQETRIGQPPPAVVIAKDLLRPLFLVLRRWRPLTWQINIGAGDDMRLLKALQIVAGSIDCQSVCNNYCGLASSDDANEKAIWLRQARLLLSLCYAVLAGNSWTWGKGEPPSSSRKLQLAALAVKLARMLTDVCQWKSQPPSMRGAEEAVLGLLSWQVTGHSEMYTAVRCLILANCPVRPSSGVKSSSEASQIASSAVLMMTEPFINLARAENVQGPGPPKLCSPAHAAPPADGQAQERSSLTSDGGPPRNKTKASIIARSAAQLSIHILTIPMVVHRLSPSDVTSLNNHVLLGPSLRAMGEPLTKVARDCGQVELSTIPTGTDSSGSAAYEDLPPVAWALANTVRLCSSFSYETLGPHISPTEYVGAMRCQLAGLEPWILKQKKLQQPPPGVGRGANSDGEEEEMPAGLPKPAAARPMHPKFLEDLSLLSSGPLVLCLLNFALGDSEQALRQAGAPPVERLLSMSDLGSLWDQLLATLKVINAGQRGGVALLNALAFNPVILPAIWRWLQRPLQLPADAGPSARAVDSPEPKSSGSSSTLRSSHGSGADSPHRSKSKGRAGDGGSDWAASLSDMLLGRGKSKPKPRPGTHYSQIPTQDATVGGEVLARAAVEQVRGDMVSPPGGWNVASMRKGVKGVVPAAASTLSVFCSACAHLLVILDDDEFYDHQVPFTLQQYRLMAATLNTLVYHTLTSSLNLTSHSNNLQHSGSLLSAATQCMKSLYERDCRRPYCPPNLWLAPAAASPLKVSAAARAHAAATATTGAAPGREVDELWRGGLGAVLNTIPHVLPFEERVNIFQELVRADKARNGHAPAPQQPGPGRAMILGPAAAEVAVRRHLIVDDGFAQLNKLGPALKGRIHVAFVSDQGLVEAGMDYGGLFKEFLTDLAHAAFNPQYGLFKQADTEEGLLYPRQGSASLGHGLPMMEFLGRLVGKALYEGILLDYSFAPLFVSKLVGRYSYLGDLALLDAELYKNLMYLKHYEGDAMDLELDFTVTQELFGRHEVVELRPGGASIPVTNANKLQYIHLMADYKLNGQLRDVVAAFQRGLADLISPTWLRLFNPSEFNQLLSGGAHDIDVEDLKAHTVYSGGYSAAARPVRLFWEVVAGFSPQERCELLKFVTSCRRGPLLGFQNLVPPFTIHQVACETSIFAMIGGQDAERLPSASTCFNTLKLPTYKRAETMREKLKYAISSNSGFELS